MALQSHCIGELVYSSACESYTSEDNEEKLEVEDCSAEAIHSATAVMPPANFQQYSGGNRMLVSQVKAPHNYGLGRWRGTWNFVHNIKNKVRLQV